MPIAVAPTRSERYGLLALVAGALLVSGIAPKDRLTGLLEVVWVIVAMPVIMLNGKRFPLTRLLCGRACGSWRRLPARFSSVRPQAAGPDDLQGAASAASVLHVHALW